LPPGNNPIRIIIIIILIRHELGLDRPVSVSSDSLFKGHPSRLRPFDVQCSVIFGIILLFVPVKCHCQFDLYLLSFSSAGSTCSFSQISSLLLWSKRVCPAVLLQKFHLDLCQSFFFNSFFLRAQISLSYKRGEGKPVRYIYRIFR